LQVWYVDSLCSPLISNNGKVLTQNLKQMKSPGHRVGDRGQAGASIVGAATRQKH
jgi:hypothetical protein